MHIPRPPLQSFSCLWSLGACILTRETEEALGFDIDPGDFLEANLSICTRNFKK